MKASTIMAALAAAGIASGFPSNHKHQRIYQTLKAKRDASKADSAPSAPTVAGTVGGCTGWHTVQNGEVCNSVAALFGLDVNTFMSWNPSVGAPGCKSLWLGYSYCVAVGNSGNLASAGTANSTGLSGSVAAQSGAASQSVGNNHNPNGVIQATTQAAAGSARVSIPTSALAATTQSSVAAVISVPFSSPSAQGNYGPMTYPGVSDRSTYSVTTYPATSCTNAVPTGSMAPSGQIGSYDGVDPSAWPTIDKWLPMEELWQIAYHKLRAGCDPTWVSNEFQNTESELADLYYVIKQVAQESKMDERFILAIILQESTGCLRVWGTANGHPNPGIMQAFNGRGNCNPMYSPNFNPSPVMPCPQETILQMVREGSIASDAGPGYQGFALQWLGRLPESAFDYYVIARIYNSGSVQPGGNINGANGATASYCENIANRLTGAIA